MRTKSILVVVAVLFMANAATAEYEVIDLGSISPDNLSLAYSINNNGQIVGNIHKSGVGAVLFDPTGNGNNITLGGREAHSINDNGQIVGYSGSTAILFDTTGNKNNIQLGTLGGTISQAHANNNNGDIVGFAMDSSGNFCAALFDNTGGQNNIDLGTLGGDYGVARSINDNGQIVGTSDDSTGTNRATLFDITGSGNNINLGTLAGWSYSHARSINNNGQIVGYVYGGTGSIERAVLFDATGGGANIDLNTLIDPTLDWTLLQAYSINDNGWIVGQGINPDGYNRAFLLTPEPATPPIADASSDQTVTDSDDNGSEEITLDGSGSSDSDGFIVGWAWIDNLGDTIPDGEITTATLSVGTHTITLTVTDDDGLTDSNTVIVTVELGPNESPDANAGEDIIADAHEAVILDAISSTDSDGDIVQYTWTALPEDEVLYSGADSTFTTKALGRVEEVIKLTVTDNEGASSEDTVSIFNRRVEEIELTPGPQGEQGPQGIQGEQGLQGEQGPAGITPAEIAQMQVQITALQQANAALLLQIQALEQQNAQLQQAIDDNRYLLEQLPQLKKQLEELMATVEEETP